MALNATLSLLLLPLLASGGWAWPADLQPLLVALRQVAAIRAINDAMADLEQLYPDTIPTARRELDAIGAIDTELAGLGPEQLQAPINPGPPKSSIRPPRIRRSQRQHPTDVMRQVLLAGVD